MDISNALAAKAYAGARTAAQPGADAAETAAGFAQLAEGFAQTMRQGEATAMAALSGKADPHALVAALAETELAVETAVTVRDRMVQAYQEILRMPV